MAPSAAAQPHSFDARKMLTSLTKRFIVLAAAAAAYVGITYLVFDALSWSDVPAGWSRMWPSRRAAVFGWWHLLNIAGAVISALPVSLLIRLLLGTITFRLGLLVGAPASLWALAAVYEYPDAYRLYPLAATTLTAVLVISLLVAVPLLGSNWSRSAR